MKRKLVMLCVVSVVLVLAAYLVVNKSIVAKPPPGSWEYRFLNGIGCRAPCWENLTPGVSKQDALTRTLVSDGQFRLGQTRFSPSNSLLGAGGFDLHEVGSASDRIGVITFEYPADGRVTAIILKSRYILELGELIALLGQPSDVVINVFPPYPGKVPPIPAWEVGMFFEQASTYVRARSNAFENLDVNAKLDIGEIVFLDVSWDHDTALAKMGVQKKFSATPWRGYMPLSDYCHALGPQSWCP
ncbi:MAG: hypothetical protein ABIQ99_16040 [Thermoflexales bacterium]